MNLESANLILRTSSVAVGTNKDSNRTNITWTNINMKSVLGTLYDKYKRFKICLTSVGNVNSATISSTADRVMALNMKGLQWVNQAYDQSKNCNTDTVVISTLIYNSAAGFSVNYTGEIGWIFEKPTSTNININLYITRVSDGTTPSTINYNESVYCFTIYGVDD